MDKKKIAQITIGIGMVLCIAWFIIGRYVYTDIPDGVRGLITGVCGGFVVVGGMNFYNARQAEKQNSVK
jgi:hypothetical protein